MKASTSSFFLLLIELWHPSRWTCDLCRKCENRYSSKRLCASRKLQVGSKTVVVVVVVVVDERSPRDQSVQHQSRLIRHLTTDTEAQEKSHLNTNVVYKNNIRVFLLVCVYIYIFFFQFYIIRIRLDFIRSDAFCTQFIDETNRERCSFQTTLLFTLGKAQEHVLPRWHGPFTNPNYTKR